MSEKILHTSGTILIDAIVALALAGFFIAVVTESAYTSRDLFDRAREREALLDNYEIHAGEFSGMTPLELRTFASTTAFGKQFGNDLIEIDLTASSTGPNGQSIKFVKVASSDTANLFDFAGSPTCSIDFIRSNLNIIGSYSFINSDNSSSSTHDLTGIIASITPIILPIDPSIPLTDIEVRHGTAYLSTDSTRSSDPDILIVDIRNPDNATIYSNLSTGPGLSGLELAGKRLYLAQTSRVAQLQIILLPQLISPTLESAYKLPLPYATATPPIASSIFYDKGKIYLGTEKWDGEEFNIIDVSNPAEPSKIGGMEIGSKVNDIFEREGLAYVAASDRKQMRAIDINDPTNPIEVASFSPSGWERQEGKVISFFEDGLQLGRTSGGFNIKNDHELFSWATTSASRWNTDTSMNSPVPGSLDIAGGVYGIVTDRSNVYLATRQINRELQIFDRKLATSTTLSFPLPVAPQTLTCDNDKLYLLAATAPVIYEISFTAHE